MSVDLEVLRISAQQLAESAETKKAAEGMLELITEVEQLRRDKERALGLLKQTTEDRKKWREHCYRYIDEIEELRVKLGEEPRPKLYIQIDDV